MDTVAHTHGAGTRSPARAAVTVGALGVVFGDIGPARSTRCRPCSTRATRIRSPVSTENVYGIVSLIFWSVMIIVTLTYVTLVMRADNDGEGGIMALITLIAVGARRAAGGRRWCWPRWGSSARRCSSATA